MRNFTTFRGFGLVASREVVSMHPFGVDIEQINESMGLVLLLMRHEMKCDELNA